MEQIFIKFLKEQGVYNAFRLRLWKKRHMTISYYVNEKSRSYIKDAFSWNDPVTDWYQIDIQWSIYWSKYKVKILYAFLVENGVLFEFIERLPQGKTMSTLFDVYTHLQTVVYNNMLKNHVLYKWNDSIPKWNKIHKKWLKHIKEKDKWTYLD